MAGQHDGPDEPDPDDDLDEWDEELSSWDGDDLDEFEDDVEEDLAWTPRPLPFQPRPGGGFTLALEPVEAQLLTTLLPDLRTLLMSPSDPSLRRLFPTAYPGDARLEAEYRDLTGSHLLEGRFADLDVVESSLAAGRLQAGELDAWLRALNAIRLVLGTKLDVGEDDDPPDPDDPVAPMWSVFVLMGILIEGAVIAASESLPPADDPD
ncbi:MAG: DUF2017 family protein [Acidimicrobiia bacterium]|nr:DUF2017 family protein [Acidimicrobiia bacterium]